MALGFIGKALGVVGKAVGIDSIGKAAIETVKSIIGKDPEVEKALVDQEIEFRRIAVQEGDSIRALYGMEIKSEKGFIAYARPGMLWLVFAIIAANFVLLPITNTIIMAIQGAGAQQIVLEYPDLPDQVYWLIGSIFGLYTGARSWDKKNKTKS